LRGEIVEISRFLIYPFPPPTPFSFSFSFLLTPLTPCKNCGGVNKYSIGVQLWRMNIRIHDGTLLDDKLWRMNIRIHDGPLLDDKLWRMNTHIHTWWGFVGWQIVQNKRFSLDDKLESALITNAPYTTRKKIGLWGGGWGGRLIIVRHATQVPTMCYFLLFFPHDWQ